MPENLRQKKNTAELKDRSRKASPESKKVTPEKLRKEIAQLNTQIVEGPEEVVQKGDKLLRSGLASSQEKDQTLAQEGKGILTVFRDKTKELASRYGSKLKLLLVAPTIFSALGGSAQEVQTTGTDTVSQLKQVNIVSQRNEAQVTDMKEYEKRQKLYTDSMELYNAGLARAGISEDMLVESDWNKDLNYGGNREVKDNYEWTNPMQTFSNAYDKLWKDNRDAGINEVPKPVAEVGLTKHKDGTKTYELHSVNKTGDDEVWRRNPDWKKDHAKWEKEQSKELAKDLGLQSSMDVLSGAVPGGGDRAHTNYAVLMKRPTEKIAPLEKQEFYKKQKAEKARKEKYLERTYPVYEDPSNVKNAGHVVGYEKITFDRKTGKFVSKEKIGLPKKKIDSPVS